METFMQAINKRVSFLDEQSMCMKVASTKLTNPEWQSLQDKCNKHWLLKNISGTSHEKPWAAVRQISRRNQTKMYRKTHRVFA